MGRIRGLILNTYNSYCNPSGSFRMLDLFSGIGGFSLAASWVWGDEEEIVAFVEIDKFCQKVLKKHWPEVPIIEDIREVTGERITAYTKNREDDFGKGRGVADAAGRWSSSYTAAWPGNQPTIDLLTGGFPCQPFSCAGKRKGQRDDRFLWPEMLRVIREVQQSRSCCNLSRTTPTSYYLKRKCPLVNQTSTPWDFTKSS